MGLKSNIVHQYFKKEIEGAKIFVKVDPIHLQGVELTVPQTGDTQARELEFDEHILDDLQADGFTEVNAMEFNMRLSGLIK